MTWVAFLTGLLIGGSLGFCACAWMVVGRTPYE